MIFLQKEKEVQIKKLVADVESFKALSEINAGRKTGIRRSTDLPGDY